jgi:hypothetical protein
MTLLHMQLLTLSSSLVTHPLCVQITTIGERGCLVMLKLQHWQGSMFHASWAFAAASSYSVPQSQQPCHMGRLRGTCTWPVGIGPPCKAN